MVNSRARGLDCSYSHTRTGGHAPHQHHSLTTAQPRRTRCASSSTSPCLAPIANASHTAAAISLPPGTLQHHSRCHCTGTLPSLPWPEAPQAPGPSPRQGLSPPPPRDSPGREPLPDFAGKPYTMAMAPQSSFETRPPQGQKRALDAHLRDARQALQTAPAHHFRHLAGALAIRGLRPLASQPQHLAPSHANTCFAQGCLARTRLALPPAGPELGRRFLPTRTSHTCTAPASDTARGPVPQSLYTDRRGYAWADVPLASPPFSSNCP